MKGGLGNLMKQAQAMQDNMKKMQEEVASMEVEGEAGIAGDKDMLEDLIAAAVNDAVRQVEKTTSEKMSGIAGGMDLPPGFKLPF